MSLARACFQELDDFDVQENLCVTLSASSKAFASSISSITTSPPGADLCSLLFGSVVIVIANSLSLGEFQGVLFSGEAFLFSLPELCLIFLADIASIVTCC